MKPNSKSKISNKTIKTPEIPQTPKPSKSQQNTKIQDHTQNSANSLKSTKIPKIRKSIQNPTKSIKIVSYTKPKTHLPSHHLETIKSHTPNPTNSTPKLTSSTQIKQNPHKQFATKLTNHKPTNPKPNHKQPKSVRLHETKPKVT